MITRRAKRHNPDAPRHRAAAAKAPVIPLRERTGRLIPQPRPRDLHGDPPHRRQPARRHPLVPRRSSHCDTAPRPGPVSAPTSRRFRRSRLKSSSRQDRRAARRDRRAAAPAAGAVGAAVASRAPAAVPRAAPADARLHRLQQPPRLEQPRLHARPAAARPPNRAAVASRSGKRASRRSRRTPCSASRLWMRFRYRVRSACSVVRPRLACRASSTSRDGTCTTCHISRSPPQCRSSSRSSFSPSSRSVFARRARRDTSMLEESTTRFVTPSVVSNRCGQNPSRPAS